MTRSLTLFLLVAAVLLPSAFAQSCTPRPNGPAQQCIDLPTGFQQTLCANGAVVFYILGAIQIAIGLFLVLFGFRLWKITSGVTGFLVGFFLVFFLVVYFWPSTVDIQWIGFGAGMGAGILIGLFLFFFPTVALFIVAIVIGVVLGIIVYDIALQWTLWQYSYFICIGVGAIALPLIAICIKKPFIIIITAFYGACCIAFGIAGFLPSGYQYIPLYVDPNVQPCTPVWPVYVFFGGILLVTLVGIILQACLFAREITWDNVRKHVCPSARQDRYNDELGTPLMKK